MAKLTIRLKQQWNHRNWSWSKSLLSTFWKFLNIDERSEAQNIFLDSCWIYFEGSDERFKRWALSQMKLYWILIDAFLPRVLSSSCLKFEPNAEYGTKRHCGTYFQLTKKLSNFCAHLVISVQELAAWWTTVVYFHIIYNRFII